MRGGLTGFVAVEFKRLGKNSSAAKVGRHTLSAAQIFHLPPADGGLTFAYDGIRHAAIAAGPPPRQQTHRQRISKGCTTKKS
jgi:hypothetical protein